MHFETLQSVSLNGIPGKANDDRVGSSLSLAWVIDGATDLGEPGLLGAQGGAAWLAATASLAFAQSHEADMAATCARLFTHVATQFEAERTRDIQARWELPKAAFAAAQLVDDRLHVAWAADCSVLHLSKTGAAWCTHAPDSTQEVAQARALGEGVGRHKIRSGAVLEDRRASRSRPGHSALSPIIEHSAQATLYDDFQVATGDQLLVMSDGFSSLVSDYGTYTGPELMQEVQSRGLASLITQIREIEHQDAGCVQFPRFKVSDDASAIWLKVAG